MCNTNLRFTYVLAYLLTYLPNYMYLLTYLLTRRWQQCSWRWQWSWCDRAGEPTVVDRSPRSRRRTWRPRRSQDYVQWLHVINAKTWFITPLNGVITHWNQQKFYLEIILLQHIAEIWKVWKVAIFTAKRTSLREPTSFEPFYASVVNAVVQPVNISRRGWDWDVGYVRWSVCWRWSIILLFQFWSRLTSTHDLMKRIGSCVTVLVC